MSIGARFRFFNCSKLLSTSLSCWHSIIAESPERFSVIRTEALRDLVVMNQIAGTDYTVELPPETLENPECERLSHDIPYILAE